MFQLILTLFAWWAHAAKPYKPIRASKLTVHLVPHTHDDVGWLKTVDQYYTGSNATIQVATVRYILDTVIESLQHDPSRKFTYVEQAFFQRWWREQTETTRNVTKQLVKSGQLVFVNGGWCMQDEAAVHYVAMIDQTSLGHRLLKEQFGDDGIPTVGWQLDPFGHSATQAALLSAEVGFEALFFGRIDYQDRELRQKEKRAEFIWRASPSLGPDAQVFAGLTGEYGGNYGPPEGFGWDTMFGSEPVEANPALDTYNLDMHVENFIKQAKIQAGQTRGNNIMWTMGSDFCYANANEWYSNMDKLIAAVNADGRMNALYSTPNDYIAAKRLEGIEWPLDQGNNSDFFPYADGPHQFWTGYFTSRPALKRYVRVNSAFQNAVRQVQALADTRSTTPSNVPPVERLQVFEEALGVAQHHDGVSGTAKQHVTFDYAKRIAKGHEEAVKEFGSGLAFLVGSGGWSRCERLNETVCNFTQAVGGAVKMAVWNQMGQARKELMMLPVSSSGVVVTDGTGKVVPSQVDAAGETVTNWARNTGEAKYVVSFTADLPAMGTNTYTIIPSSSSATPSTQKDGSYLVLKNEYVALTFIDGRLSSMADLETGTQAAVQQSFCWYASNTGDMDSYQRSGAYIFRPVKDTVCNPILPASGQVEIEAVVQGGVVQEVRQKFSSWLTQTIRLSAGQHHAEFEYTVGAIAVGDPTAPDNCVGWYQTSNCNAYGARDPTNDKKCDQMVSGNASGYCQCADGREVQRSGCAHESFTCSDACVTSQLGKEVVSRFDTDIQSNGGLLTDSNGREMLVRKRDYRPTWNLTQTEPIAGNFFPVNSAAAISDATRQLTVLVDASQGGASLSDGSLELMVHRRVFEDDNRGVGEPLDETRDISSYDSGYGGGVHSGPGLVIRGKHWVTLQPPAAAAAVWRPLADRLFSTPHVMFSTATATTTASVDSSSSSYSALLTGLPLNVQIMTLQELEPNKLLLRLSHQFGIGEHPLLSKPVSVDLAKLFNPLSAFAIKDVKEVSLTYNQDKSAIMEKRKAALAWSAAEPHAWRAEGPLKFSADPVVTLGPLEIKTFILHV